MNSATESIVTCTLTRVAICFTTLAVLVAQSAEAVDRDVSAYYYPWYAKPTEGHWRQGLLRTRLAPPSPPLLGLYDSRDRSVIRTHLGWSQDYGIDNWVCSWWGRDSFEDTTLLQRVLPEIEGGETTFCVYYESQGLLGMNPQEEIVFDEDVQSKLVNDIRYLAEQYFPHPNYQRIDGRPVVHFYLSRCYTGQYAEALTSAREAARGLGHEVYFVGDEIFWGVPDAIRIGQFDAITAYCMHGPIDFAGFPQQSDLLKHLTIKFDEHARIASDQGVRVIPNVFPGYNNRGSGGTTYVIPRHYAPVAGPTSTFRMMARWAENYIDPKLNMVCVTSFNEWHEDTQIEPTVATGVTTNDDTHDQLLTSGYRYRGYGAEYLELIREHFGQARESEDPR